MGEQPEPNGWELLRSVKDLKDSVDKLAAGMVTQAMFAMYQEAQTRERTADRERLVALETDIAEARRTKAQNTFSLALSGVAILGSIITGIVLWRVGAGG